MLDKQTNKQPSNIYFPEPSNRFPLFTFSHPFSASFFSDKNKFTNPNTNESEKLFVYILIENGISLALPCANWVSFAIEKVIICCQSIPQAHTHIHIHIRDVELERE